WGVNTATLLAGAGILTLVIGLGAQSLVSDIVAGMFIVFEGEFEVGDIVVINGWRGTVQEVGIRTTKIVDAGGNVNIVNNSQITSIINQTQEISVAKCEVGIEYGASIPKVEEVIKNNLDTIKNNIPAIIEGPYYKGVSALGESSVNLLLIAKCKEEDVYQVQRDMNREIKLIFDDNDINIPFPQVVLNQPKSKD
ncbi:MAG: mechanosensitive ion channel family protein, partial [Christensenellales bacterium]